MRLRRIISISLQGAIEKNSNTALAILENYTFDSIKIILYFWVHQ